MKYLFPMIVSLPTAFVVLSAFVGLVSGTSLLATLGLPGIVAFYPVIAFIFCIVLAWTKIGGREWVYAAVFNVVPVISTVLLLLFFAAIGFNG